MTGPTWYRVRVVSALLASAVGAVAPAVAQHGPLVAIETLDHAPVGRLEAIDSAAGSVRLSDRAEGELALAGVYAVRFLAPESAALRAREWVTLADGGEFSAAGAEVGEGRVRFTTTDGGQVVAPLEGLAGWARDRAAGERIREAAAESDTLLAATRDGSPPKEVAGVVLGFDPAGVTFAMGPDSLDDPIVAPWGRVAGLRLSQSRPREPGGFSIRTADGNRYGAESFDFDGTTLAWRGAEGVSGRVDARRLESIDPRDGRVTPVAALRVDSSRWTPYAGPASDRGGHALDASVAGGALAVRFVDPRAPAAWPGVGVTREFATGVALRSRGELRFALPQGARRLKGWVAIDPATAAAGDALASILADGAELWSGRVNGQAPPAEVAADVTGARSLTLRVDYGADLDAGDAVHFAELRVLR